MLQFDRGTTYQATVAWPLWRTATANVSIEVPIIATPAFTVVTSGASLPLEYASLYLTPGARVTVVPNGPVPVFGAVRAGSARHSESRAEGCLAKHQTASKQAGLQCLDSQPERCRGVRRRELFQITEDHSQPIRHGERVDRTLNQRPPVSALREPALRRPLNILSRRGVAVIALSQRSTTPGRIPLFTASSRFLVGIRAP